MAPTENSRQDTIPDLSIEEKIIEFIANFVAELSPQADFIQQLPRLIEAIGNDFGLAKIVVKINSGSVYQEINWSDNRSNSGRNKSPISHTLPKSGPQNSITYDVYETASSPKTVFKLLSAIIDFILASQQLLAIEHSQRELVESINHISKILTSTLDQNELLSLFLDQLEILAPYDSASVMLLQDGLLFMHAARGYENFSEPVDISEISFIPDETFLMNEVLNGEDPIVLHDTKLSPRWTWSPVGKHIRSWMGVPLIVEGKVIGLFSLDKSTPNFFSEEHASVASALAKHAALALDNALLFARVRQAHQDLQGLSVKIIEAQEKERQRIAMELHDHSGQALLALRAELQVLRHFISVDAAEVQEHIDYLDEIVVSISRDMERLAHDMRPPSLKDLGLATVLEQYMQEFEQRMHISATFVHDLEGIRFPDNIELVCYRIIQEALTNLAKHAKADSFEVTMNFFENVLYLVVSDNGVGFTKKSHQKGYGLVGIRERLSQIQGTLEIRSTPGKGTELLVTIPIPTKGLSNG